MSTTLTLNGMYNTWLNDEIVEVQTPEDWNLLTIFVNAKRNNANSDYIITNIYDNTDILTIPVANVETIRNKAKQIRLLNDLNFQYGEIQWIRYLGYRNDTRSLNYKFFLDGNSKKIFNVFFIDTNSFDSNVTLNLIFPYFIKDFILENCYFNLSNYNSLYVFYFDNQDSNITESKISNIIIKDCRFEFIPIDLATVVASMGTLFYINGNFTLAENIQSACTIIAQTKQIRIIDTQLNNTNIQLQKCCSLNTIQAKGRLDLQCVTFVASKIQKCFTRNRYGLGISIIRNSATSRYGQSKVSMVYDASIISQPEGETIPSYIFISGWVSGSNTEDNSQIACYFDEDILNGTVTVSDNQKNAYGISTTILQSVGQMQLRGWDVVSY